MPSFRTAAFVLAAGTSAPSPTSGFVARPSTPPATTTTVGPLRATEAFQRSLLEARLANDGDVAAAATTEELDEQGADPVNGGAAGPLPSLADAPPPSADLTSVQNSLLRIAASTDRGQFAKPAQKEEASRLLAEMESNAPERASSLEASVGTWELLYSDTQLFRSSPFFLAGRATCRTEEEARRYDWFCDMHRAALAISTVGTVRQAISSEGRITNEFEVKVGAVPFLSDFLPLRYSGGLPFTIDGAIVSTANVAQTAPDEWEVYMDAVEIKGSNVPLLRNVLDAGNVALRSRDLSKFLEDNVAQYETPKPVLRATYVDDAMRIVRDQDDNAFVYGKVSGNEEGTDYSSVDADLGVASLLEGFNDAVARVYL
ncbi:hypothetical protein ACHAWF_018420 [Thalassiosira exigua]